MNPDQTAPKGSSLIMVHNVCDRENRMREQTEIVIDDRKRVKLDVISMKIKVILCF